MKVEVKTAENTRRDKGTCNYTVQLHIQWHVKKDIYNWLIITSTMKTTTRDGIFHYMFVIPFTCFLKNKFVSTFGILC